MKLMCDTHQRRVHTFQTPTKLVDKDLLSVVTVHRNDGTHCDAGILRLGRHLFSPEEVVQTILPLPAMAAIRKQEAKKLKENTKKQKRLSKKSS